MEKNNSAEVFRFLFSIIIVYYHVVGQLEATAAGAGYRLLADLCLDANLVVDCFLIMGGYFLYQSFAIHQDRSVFDFSARRLMRLWPAYMFACAAAFVFQPSRNIIYDIFLLRSTGLSLVNEGILWYVGPYFWCGIVIYSILRICRNKELRFFILAALVYFGYLVNINYTNGTMDRIVVYDLFSLSMLRILAGLSVGCILFAICRKLSVIFESQMIFKNIGGGVFTTAFEALISVVLLCYFVACRIHAENKLFIVLLFSVFFVSLVLKQGKFFSFLNKESLGKFGRYSYSIYVMQTACILFLEKTLWKNEQIFNFPALCILISVSFCVGVGIAIYYMIEMRANRLLRRLSNNG